MDLSISQQDVIESKFGMNILVEGYSGVGKSTVLLKKYEKLFQNKLVSKNDTVIIVSNDLKKQILSNQYFLMTSNYNTLNIYSINELIYKYLNRIDLPLFSNTIDKFKKMTILSHFIEENNKHDFTDEFIIDEINFIQNNLCLKDDADIESVLNKELKVYLNIPRRTIKKGLLSFREKQYIWSIYTKYINKSLSEDFFDEQTLYQSFLRLIFHHNDYNELALTFSNILIDDIQDFSKIQLDIIYYLFNQESENHSLLLTLDDLKSKERHRYYKNSILLKAINKIIHLDLNYRSSKNVFQIIQTNINNNELLKFKHPYNSVQKLKNKSVLTYFYNKSKDEKQEVFFDRLDVLIHNMEYKLSDILVIFYDQDNLEEMRNQCLANNLNVFDIYDHVSQPNHDALTFMYKEDLTSCEFKIVIIYDADNKKLCTGPINQIINVNNNYIDSIYFYQSLSIAVDFLIINSSISEPSHLLLPSRVDYSQFVFEINSKFEIKSTLNVYRKSDFVNWLKENLEAHYDFKENHFFNHEIFDLLIDIDYYKIGFKILDNNIDSSMISYILKNGLNLTHIIIIDRHHYLTFKNMNQEFIRIIDIPNK